MLTFMCRLGLMTLTVATLSTVVLAADGNPELLAARKEAEGPQGARMAARKAKG